MASTFLSIFILFHCINIAFLTVGDALEISTIQAMAPWTVEFYGAKDEEIQDKSDSEFDVWNPFALGGAGSTILNIWFTVTGTSFLAALNIGLIHLPYPFIVGVSFIIAVFLIVDIFNRLRGTPGE